MGEVQRYYLRVNPINHVAYMAPVDGPVRKRGEMDSVTDYVTAADYAALQSRIAELESRNAASERVASIAAEMREAVDAIQAPYEWIAPSSVYAWADELDAAIDAHAQGQAGEEKDG